jgi:alkylation response protein AidB-like acyl-CoA dehydrogenase
MLYSAGPKFAYALWATGNERDQRIAKIMIERLWGATMVLTEPDAALMSAPAHSAIPQPDGTWHIEGVKRFITSGEHDLTENIIHLVLARPQGVEGVGGPGTKGLSLFVVPSSTLILRPASSRETQRGLRDQSREEDGHQGLATCELTFGGTRCPPRLAAGRGHDGIAQMFRMIEHARMLVGTKAIATLSTGYLNALEYAKTRVQVLISPRPPTGPRRG